MYLLDPFCTASTFIIRSIMDCFFDMEKNDGPQHGPFGRFNGAGLVPSRGADGDDDTTLSSHTAENTPTTTRCPSEVDPDDNDKSPPIQHLLLRLPELYLC